MVGIRPPKGCSKDTIEALGKFQGSKIAIVSSGQTATTEAAMMLRDKNFRIIAVNLSFRLAPFADMLYAADDGFWLVYQEALRFEGLKLCAGDMAPLANPGKLHKLDIPHLDGRRIRTLIREPLGVIGSGGNSGFQALNLAAQLSNKIVLVGYDYVGSHWHEDHGRLLRNPTEDSLIKWANEIDTAYHTLKEWGVEVINTSPISRIKNIPYKAVGDIE